MPIVIGPAQIPRITTAVEAFELPEIAMLSALVHGAKPDGHMVIEVALRAAARLDEDRMRTYFDLVYATLGELARSALEALMPLGNYEYKSDFAKKYVAQGRAEGIQEGLQEGRAEGEAAGVRAALLSVLAARELEVSEETHRLIEGCSDIALLKEWIRRAVLAERTEEVFRID